MANFIRERLPAYYAERGDSVETAVAGPMTWYTDRASEDEEVRDAAKEWADALAERGWIAPHWPKEYGGGGLSQVELVIFREEMSKASAPGVGGSGVSLLGPTLLLHGSEEQRRKYLGDILSGDVAWAQGYSEPGAGSDLASLSTRAQRDGDEYIVNGQKIWTSGAHDADALFALVRTDPEAPKHRGISFLLIDDIHASGITVRPLIDATWSHHINEVFFDSVRVPVSNLLGEENRGWYVAMTLLDHERSGIGSAAALLSEITALIAEVTEDGRSQLARNPVLRSRLADLVIGAAITHKPRASRRLDAGGGSGAELRGLDDQALPQRAEPGAAPRRPASVRIARADLAGRRPGGARRPAHLPLHTNDSGDDRRRQLRGAAQHHRDARARAAAGLTAERETRPRIRGG